MARVTAPDRVSVQHQKLLHFVASCFHPPPSVCSLAIASINFGCGLPVGCEKSHSK
jgi:hypothetical protein